MAIMTQACGSAHDYELEGTGYPEPLFIGEQTQIITIMVVSLTEVATFADDEKVSNYRALFTYKDVIGTSVRENNGSLLHTVAGCITACFGIAQDALRAAIRIQAAVDERNLHNVQSGPVLVRIGLHTGQGTAWQQRAERNTAVVAEYCESMAHGGEIVLTEETRNSLQDRDEVYSLFMKTLTLQESPPHVFNIYQAIWNPTEVEVVRNPCVKDPKNSLLPMGRKLAIGLLIVMCYLGVKVLENGKLFHPQKSRTIYQYINQPVGRG